MAHYKETHKGALGVDFTLIQEGNDTIFHHHQDAGPILEENSRLRQHRQYGTPVMGARLVARVPLILDIKWKQEFHAKTGHRANERGYQEMYRAFKMAKLDLPEYKHLRIDEGRLGVKSDVGKITLSTNVKDALRSK